MKTNAIKKVITSFLYLFALSAGGFGLLLTFTVIGAVIGLPMMAFSMILMANINAAVNSPQADKYLA